MDGAFIWRLPWPAGTCIALHHLAGVCWHHEKLSVRPHHPSPHLGPRLTPANCLVWEEAQCDPASILWSNMWQGAQTEAQSGHWDTICGFCDPSNWWPYCTHAFNFGHKKLLQIKDILLQRIWNYKSFQVGSAVSKVEITLTLTTSYRGRERSSCERFTVSLVTECQAGTRISSRRILLHLLKEMCNIQTFAGLLSWSRLSWSLSTVEESWWHMNCSVHSNHNFSLFIELWRAV